ncbi:probable GPI-anchored adhesin-like protein PGA18 isoform X1 [Orbicella faveolata]|uniref:probable GPI-anchored adhesin-like protein PGA18 isoform X1 n=1 Tax=Orbicella faveolata TaxID=48498 RepID=UPI0009E58DD6|nr:probable GPI-anchored adhesin-like protein PGA18 isoform X1 [Orbicella faveolata]XP_020632685.1 probable GPI-anchored adhesin-like protein PGA18 isoform X1 [Orbicella faveolata]
MATFYLIAKLMMLQVLVFSYDVSSSTTMTQMNAATPSSIVVASTTGSIVTLTLRVTTNCSGVRLMMLNDSLQNDTKAIYIAEGFPIKSVITQSISCNSSLNITLELSFDTGIPSEKTIEEVFQAALKDGNITNLTENNTIYTFSCSIVILTLTVTTNCSGNRSMELNVSLQNDIKDVYIAEGFLIKWVIIRSIICNCYSSLDITLELWFYTVKIPSRKTIEGVFQAALKDGNITSLTENNTIYTFSNESSLSTMMTEMSSTPTQMTCTPSSSVVASTPDESSSTMMTEMSTTPTQMICPPSSSVVASTPDESSSTMMTEMSTTPTQMTSTPSSSVVASTPDESSSTMMTEMSTTPTQMTSTPGRSVVASTPGPIVILMLTITTNCSGDRLMTLKASMQIDIKDLYVDEKFPIKSVIIQSNNCTSHLNITLQLSFYTGIPSGKTIKGVFQAALKDGKITNLTESNTICNIKFTGK